MLVLTCVVFDVSFPFLDGLFYVLCRVVNVVLAACYLGLPVRFVVDVDVVFFPQSCDVGASLPTMCGIISIGTWWYCTVVVEYCLVVCRFCRSLLCVRLSVRLLLCFVVWSFSFVLLCSSFR